MTASETDHFLSTEVLRPIRSRLEADLQRTIAGMVAEIDPDLGINAVGDALQDYMGLPGKRLRSLLFLLTLQALDPDHAIDDEWYPVATGIELFHEFLLIHDDLIDSSSTRRGAPTLWRRLEADLRLPTTRARSIATILGDLLHARAVDRVAAAAVTASIRIDLIHNLLATAGQTGWGAAAEILSAEAPIHQATESSIRAIYLAKTSRYTFELPMIMAAILTGKADSLGDILTAIARPLGLGFQVENDLHELMQLKAASYPVPVDLVDHVKTLPMVHLYACLRSDDRARLETSLSGPFDENARSLVTELMDASELLASMQNVIDEAFEEPYRNLDQATNLDPATRENLRKIVQFIQTNRNHSEA